MLEDEIDVLDTAISDIYYTVRQLKEITSFKEFAEQLDATKMEMQALLVDLEEKRDEQWERENALQNYEYERSKI